MKYFPAFVDLTKHAVAIVGGGNVAQRKLEVLLKFTRDITLISPEFCSGIALLAKQHELTLIRGEYAAEFVKHAGLVIAATDDEGVNQQVCDDTQTAKQWVNVVDQPELCDYITPAIIDRSPVCFALSSGGTSPVLLRSIRAQLESLLPFNLGEIALFCDSKRDDVKRLFGSVDERRFFWEAFFQQLTIKPANGEPELEALFQELSQRTHKVQPICYHLNCIDMEVDDLNLRALKRLQAADLMIYGDDLDQAFVEFVRRDAEKIPQQDIDRHQAEIDTSAVIIALNVNEQHIKTLQSQSIRIQALLSPV